MCDREKDGERKRVSECVCEREREMIIKSDKKVRMQKDIQLIFKRGLHLFC